MSQGQTAGNEEYGSSSKNKVGVCNTSCSEQVHSNRCHAAIVPANQGKRPQIRCLGDFFKLVPLISSCFFSHWGAVRREWRSCYSTLPLLSDHLVSSLHFKPCSRPQSGNEISLTTGAAGPVHQVLPTSTWPCCSLL